MEMLEALPTSPKYIDDMIILANALHTLKALEQRHGREYIFEYIQQPMVGGTCHPVPTGLPYRKNSSRVIATFDKTYFERRLAELNHGEYLH